MLNEFSGGRQVTYRVNPQHGGNVEVVSEVHAADYFKEMDGDAANSPVAPDKTNSARRRGSAGGSSSSSASWSTSRRLRRRVQSTLEHIFLPAGYPNTVTDDLLTFALWDVAQVLATNVMSTLSTRAVLLGVGVGESGANLTSSTLSWMMRDGTWLLGSIFFASVISQDLEYRAKSWRLVADITNDSATFLELCAPLFPGGQLIFRLVVVIASVIKALVGVCGGGTRASFTQHFALRGNAADVAAKAGTRGNVGSLIGLALGVIVAYIVPASSTVLNLSVFVLSTVFHLFANYKGVRSVQLRHLNAPRLEWCCEKFCHYEGLTVVAAKKDISATTAAMPVLDISVQRANAEEPLFILPALPALPPRDATVADMAYRVFRQHLCPPTLQLRIHCGASFYKVLTAQTGLTAACKQALVQSVEESLATRGIALLFDEASMSYYMILPEFYTVEGVPESWMRYKRQYEAGRREQVKQRKFRPGTSASKDAEAGVAEEKYKTAAEEAEEADEEARAEIERLRKERVVVPPHVLPLAYRELWAFFYAYMHCRAARERRARGLPHPNAVLTTHNINASDSEDAAVEKSTLHVIDHLRADGVLDEGKTEGQTNHGGEGGDDSTTATMVTPDVFEEMTSPTSTTTSRAHAFPRRASEGAAAVIAARDGLFPRFIEFVRGLRKTGWELDRLLIDNEGCTTVVHYL